MIPLFQSETIEEKYKTYMSLLKSCQEKPSGKNINLIKNINVFNKLVVDIKSYYGLINVYKSSLDHKPDLSCEKIEQINN